MIWQIITYENDWYYLSFIGIADKLETANAALNLF